MQENYFSIWLIYNFTIQLLQSSFQNVSCGNDSEEEQIRETSWYICRYEHEYKVIV